jgi:hypothetical protein
MYIDNVDLKAWYKLSKHKKIHHLKNVMFNIFKTLKKKLIRQSNIISSFSVLQILQRVLK